ncbi:DNA cytosine methyltransferase [Aerococcus urinaeequi]|uniref:DNA cytosine methyltransferase n=1 Tax=Aerococcus urinaeequi TaxID=51665 RepID=UPI003D6B9CF5
MKLRVLENFAGIGTQRMALENLGIEHEVVGITEIDKFAIKSYEAIHGKVNNLGDISLVDPNDVLDHDLFTYSFPCQDISVAGKGKGFEKGSGTRSGLLWECEKVIRAKKPKYLLMENVKNLVSKKFKPGFEEWLQALEDMGYTNYWQVLNAKDYGIPQNRERVFCVSILGEHEPYKFPEKETLELRLKDILEHEVDEKFYLDNDKAKQLIATVSDKYDIQETTPTDGGLKEPKPKEVANTILARYDAGISNQQSTGTMVIEPKVINPLKGKTDNGWHFEQQVYDSNGIARAVKAGGGSGNIPKVIEPKAERIGGIFDKDGKRHQAGAIWDKEQLAPTLDTMKGGWRQPSVLIKNNTKQGYVEATDGDGVDLAFPSSNTRRGRVQKEVAQTLDTSDSKGVIEGMRIRKLTPKECWRLMGISDDDFEKAQEANSNTQLYKQAGNAIVVDVLEAIFSNMFK